MTAWVESGVERLVSGIHTEWLVMAGTAVPCRVKEAAGRRYPRRDLPSRAYRSTAPPSSAVDGVPDETTCESDFGLFSDLQCIVDFDAKVTYR